MAKVAKSLRRLRTERGWTQEQLAEQLHVTRQAVSNWEIGKTQPDLDTLTAIAALLETDLETLIYGSRKHVGTDEPVQDNRIRTVLAVLGTLLVGVGLVLIFVNFWRDFPTALQAVFAVLPILIGQAAAAYVFLKKRDNVLFREGAAVLWFVGVISTVALVNSVFDIHCGFQTCLLLDLVLCLPVLWLFTSVATLPVYLGMVLCWIAGGGQFLPAAVLLVLGILLVAVLQKDRTDNRYKFAVWISTIAAVLFCFFQLSITSKVGLSTQVFPFLIPPVLAVLLLDRERDWRLPFAPLGVLGCSAVQVLLSIFGWESPLIQHIGSSSRSQQLFTAENWVPEIASISPDVGRFLLVELILSAALVAVCAVLRRDTFSDNMPKVLAAACMGGTFVFALVGLGLEAAGWLLGCVLGAIGFGAALLWSGIAHMRLTYVNFGLLVLFAQCIQLLLQLQIHILFLGILLVMFGGLLIGINVKLTRDKQEQEAAEAAEAAKETEADA